ncbi:MAG: DNA polymerase IV [Pseudomonadales bacterium]|jgi:DNA polymerase-4|nr:DNA polymerase IV [Pseudomonadales bacterium]
MNEGVQRKIIHCDCDCFYAAVEVRDRPELAGRPVAVGGTPDGRGVIATCNYEARRYGVHSAQPAARALRLCPDLVLIRPDMDKYREVSRAVQEIFRRFTEVIEPVSLDEAYLDVTGTTLLRGSGTLIAEAIRGAVRRELGITLSAGVAPNRFLAKVASDWNKPDGQFVIRPEDVDDFVRALPVARLHGVGPRTAERLARMDVHDCADLRALGPLTLAERFGSFGHRLWELSQGIDARPVQPRTTRKSVSVERTFAEDIEGLPGCLRALEDLFKRLEQRLERAGGDEAATKRFVKVRFDDFTTTTAEGPALGPAGPAFERLLATAWDRGRRPVRLLGIGVGFRARRAPAEQLPLWDGASDPRRASPSER